MNTKAYYKLHTKRDEIEEQLNMCNDQIKNITEEYKKLPKKSEERVKLQAQVNEIKNSYEYKLLKEKMGLMNYCINTVFYS